MPARLRMQVIRTHGSDPVDFELWCLAVSAINGCGVCVEPTRKFCAKRVLTRKLSSPRFGWLLPFTRYRRDGSWIEQHPGITLNLIVALF